MTKRKESDTAVILEKAESPYRKRQRLADYAGIQPCSKQPPQRLYRSNATQTLEPVKCIHCSEKDIKPTNGLIREQAQDNLDQHIPHVIQWAQSLPEEYEDMSNPNPFNKRPREEVEEVPSVSARSSDYSQFDNIIGQHGIMSHELVVPDKAKCLAWSTYLDGDLTPSGTSLICPLDQLENLIQRARSKPEVFVQRNILPWTVPSTEALSHWGEWDASHLEEQMDAIWSMCAVMGHTQPKPDYVVGPAESSFSPEEINEMAKFHTKDTPLRVNPGMILPFLICEAKSGQKGLLAAERQNLHAGGIVVRAMFRLQQAACPGDREGLSNMCEDVLVWTIDLTAENLDIWGHYGKLDDTSDLETLRIYRHRLEGVRLYKPEERFTCYNFVRNIYKDFAPKHLTRIKEALAQLRANRMDRSTGLSFGTSITSLQQPEELDHGERVPPEQEPTTDLATLIRQVKTLEEGRKADLEEMKRLRREVEAARRA